MPCVLIDTGEGDKNLYDFMAGTRNATFVLAVPSSLDSFWLPKDVFSSERGLEFSVKESILLPCRGPYVCRSLGDRGGGRVDRVPAHVSIKCRDNNGA